jgi:hypothetical protein
VAQIAVPILLRSHLLLQRGNELAAVHLGGHEVAVVGVLVDDAAGFLPRDVVDVLAHARGAHELQGVALGQVPRRDPRLQDGHHTQRWVKEHTYRAGHEHHDEEDGGGGGGRGQLFVRQPTEKKDTTTMTLTTGAKEEAGRHAGGWRSKRWRQEKVGGPRDNTTAAAAAAAATAVAAAIP